MGTSWRGLGDAWGSPWGRLGQLWGTLGRPWGRLGSPARESLGKIEEKPPGETSKNPRSPRMLLGQLSFRCSALGDYQGNGTLSVSYKILHASAKQDEEWLCLSDSFGGSAGLHALELQCATSVKAKAEAKESIEMSSRK